VTALWAASPIVDGRATPYQSYRAACWLDTDPDRCGLLPFVFAPEAPERLYADYADWALDVPMFFLRRDGVYRPVGGVTFRRFLAEGLDGERATAADWELHLSTLFPEARLKQYLECRGADASHLGLVTALPALYRGLLYDAQARAAAWSLVAGWSFAEREEVRREVPREGMATRVRGRPLGGLCRELVAIAREGLRRLGADEDLALLEPVEAIAAAGRSYADEIRQAYQASGGDVAALIAKLALPLR
jgi:glutamate--cysteine ligase